MNSDQHGLRDPGRLGPFHAGEARRDAVVRYAARHELKIGEALRRLIDAGLEHADR